MIYFSFQDNQMDRKELIFEREICDSQSDGEAEAVIDLPAGKELNYLPEVQKASMVMSIFCGKARKRYNARWQSLHTSINNSVAVKISKCASEVNDMAMLGKINNSLRSNRIISYHNICMYNFKYACKRRKPHQRTQFYDSRDFAHLA